MSDSYKKVDCDAHGTTDATYVCQHLLSGEKQGFNLGYDPDNPDDLHPDAWCDKCQHILEQEGEWNERSEAFAAIRLLCAQCYQNSRDRNWIEAETILHQLITTSCHYLNEKQEQFCEHYKINDHERWDWDQGTGKLIFSHNEKPQVEADIHFSGSYSHHSTTWMWAWANPHLDEIIKQGSRNIRTLGKELGLKKLVAGNWQATETDGWNMTSVFAKHFNAIGAYRTPNENGFVYMVVTKATWVN